VGTCDDVRRRRVSMIDLFHVLLFFHFLGLALGFTVGFSNIVMSRLIAAADPTEKAVLGRFPPAVSQLGRVGLALLWLTGLTMVYTRYGGLGTCRGRSTSS
jgi:hypothetical protein